MIDTNAKHFRYNRFPDKIQRSHLQSFALGFLVHIGGQKNNRHSGNVSSDIPDFAGNPINAYAARLALSPPAPAAFRTRARGFCAIPLSLHAGLILSLITLLATIFSPAPPIGGAAGIGMPSLQEFFVSLTGLLFVRPVLLRRSAVSGFPRRRPVRSRVPEERQSVCLLR